MVVIFQPYHRFAGLSCYPSCHIRVHKMAEESSQQQVIQKQCCVSAKEVVCMVGTDALEGLNGKILVSAIVRALQA